MGFMQEGGLVKSQGTALVQNVMFLCAFFPTLKIAYFMFRSYGNHVTLPLW